MEVRCLFFFSSRRRHTRLVRDWSSDVCSSDLKTGLTLNSGTYYTSVKAKDNAGNVSDIITSNGVILDLDGPAAGTIADGTTTDNDWSNSTTTLSANWSAFSDTLSGIQKYEYAIGTSSGGTDVVNWADNSTDITVTRTDLTLTNGTA